MTTAPPTLVGLQNKLVQNLGTVNLGIVGDDAHVATGGYHIGARSLRAAGMGNDYSLQYAADRAVDNDYACAIDIGGSPSLLMTLGNRLVHALQKHDTRVYGRIRAVNAPFDGVSIDRRLDDENPATSADDNVQSSEDRNHIHIEIYRNLVTNAVVINDLYNVLAGVGVAPNQPAPLPTIEEEDMRIIVGERQSLALQVRGIDDVRVLQEGERQELEACGFPKKQVSQAQYDDLRRRARA